VPDLTPEPTSEPDLPNPGFPEYRIDIEPEFVAIEVELPASLHLTPAQVAKLESRLYRAIDGVLASALTLSAMNEPTPSTPSTEPVLPEPDWEAWEASFTEGDPIDLA
jgi:hypothetical protein